MITIHFDYNKPRVLQALRYHFISRPELRLMIILINVFALLSAILFYLKKVDATAFLIGSVLWFGFMIVIWFVLPQVIYRKAATFQDHFTMNFDEQGFSLGNERGSREWPWKAVAKMVESPHFFHLYFDSRSFFLIPKEGCKTTEELMELRGLIKSKTK